MSLPKDTLSKCGSSSNPYVVYDPREIRPILIIKTKPDTLTSLQKRLEEERFQRMRNKEILILERALSLLRPLVAVGVAPFYLILIKGPKLMRTMAGPTIKMGLNIAQLKMKLLISQLMGKLFLLMGKIRKKANPLLGAKKIAAFFPKLVADLAKALARSVLQPAGQVISRGAEWAQYFQTQIGALGNRILEGWNGQLAHLKNLASRVGSTVRNGLQNLANQAGNLLSSFANPIANVLQNGWGHLMQTSLNFLTRLNNWSNESLSRLTSFLQNSARSLGDLGRSLVSPFTRFFEGRQEDTGRRFSEVMDAVLRFRDKTLERAKTAYENAQETVKDIGRKIADVATSINIARIVDNPVVSFPAMALQWFFSPFSRRQVYQENLLVRINRWVHRAGKKVSRFVSALYQQFEKGKHLFSHVAQSLKKNAFRLVENLQTLSTKWGSILLEYLARLLVYLKRISVHIVMFLRISFAWAKAVVRIVWILVKEVSDEFVFWTQYRKKA